MGKDAKPAPTRRLAAIMACDISGYSRVMGLDESRALRHVERLTKLTESAVERFGGGILKRLGDGVLIEFPSAVTAVECAITMQQRLAAYNREAPEAERFGLRIGIHLGEVVDAGSDVLGDGLNIASRIEPLAPPGGICISDDVRRQLQNQARFRTASLGAQQLKNIAQPLEVHRVLLDGEVAPAGATVSAAKTAPGVRRRWPWIAGAAVAGVLVLGILNGAAQRKAIQKQIEQSLVQAKSHFDDGEPAAAVELLEAALPSIPPQHAMRAKIEQAIDKGRDAVEKQQVIERWQQFIEALLADNAAKASTYFAPESQTRRDVRQRRPGMRLLQGMAALLKLSADDFRAVRCDLSDDRTRAAVAVQMRVKDQWADQKPSRWVRVGGVWYLEAR